MADQKAMKKRLKALMSLPENQVCSDCTERQPRWASLIVPPPGAPEGSLAIGAFCCLECSGSHRRLGVHISFVRSINLDSWKEKEVLAMENGGNNKVNAIFEARLNGQKPNNHADLNTRERFIRDKYERRKFYDPDAFAKVAAMPRAAAPPPKKSQPQTAHAPSFDADFSQTESSGSVGVPSAAARRRMEARRSSSNLSESRSIKQPSRSKSTTSNPVGDLLDFSNDPPSDRSVGRKKSNEKLVEGRGVPRRKSKDGSKKKAGGNDLLAFDDAPAPAPASAGATGGGDFAAFASSTPAATPAPAPNASSQDIMALYGAGAARAAPTNNGGMNNMNMQTGQMNQMMQQMSLQNQQQQAMGMAQNQAQMQQQAMMYQQHMMRLQQMQAAGMQQGMMGNNNMGGGGFVNPQQQQMNMMQQRSMVSSDGKAVQGGLASMASAGSSQNSDASNDPFASLGANGFR